MTNSSTASELNQGKELLTVERVQQLRRRGYVRMGPDACDMLDALCDYWLSSRSSEAPSRRGEGEKRAIETADTIERVLNGYGLGHPAGTTEGEMRGLLADAMHQLRRLSTQNTEGWRPIESAPRDGTVVWAWRDGEQAMAYRVERDDCEMWYFGGTTAAEHVFPKHKPTHWRPLPAPPTLASRDVP